MASANKREVWLRGPLSDMPPLLQPIAHALMQAQEEVTALMQHFPESLLWKRPMGQSWNDQSAQPIASVGFHLQHLTGVLDRLLTYARGEMLSKEQLFALVAEESPVSPLPTIQALVQQFDEQVERALAQLRSTDEQTLTDARGVGRAQLPSTVIGLLVHAAEHTMRHVGQLSVTTRLITL